MEKLIVIEGNNKYQFKDLRSLIEKFINKNYFNMTKEKQEKELEKKAVANTMLRDIKIVKIDKDTNNYSNKFIFFNEITYILSLAKFNIIFLLERVDANIFGRYINRDNLKDNYIIINKFVDEIMRNYLKEGRI